MSLWHADLDGPALVSGAGVEVFNDHRVVRVVTSDQVSIQTPSGARLTAVVIDRTGDELTLSMPEASPVILSLIEDDSFAPKAGQAFSRQVWVVN